MSRQCKVLHARAVMLALLLSFGLMVPQAFGQQSPSASSVTTPTNLLFTVVDEKRLFMTTLRKEDVRVSEDGQPQEILDLQQQSGQLLSFVLMLDTSVSQEHALPNAKIAAQAFILSLMRSGKDAASVISFRRDATLENEMTSDVARVRRAIDGVKFIAPTGYYAGGVTVATPPSNPGLRPEGSTAIWDAIWVAADEVLSATPATTRRAIIILTDGMDTGSRKTMSEAIDRALKAHVAIYAIGIGDKMYGELGLDYLRKLAERTGGRLFTPKRLNLLPDVFTEIEQELRSQYVASYLSTNKKGDTSMRKIKIEIVNPELRKQKLRLSYPQGYFPQN